MQTSTAADSMKFWLQDKKDSDSEDYIDYEDEDVNGGIRGRTPSPVGAPREGG